METLTALPMLAAVALGAWCVLMIAAAVADEIGRMTSEESYKSPVFLAPERAHTIEDTLRLFAERERRELKEIRKGVYQFVDGYFCYAVGNYVSRWGIYRDYDEDMTIDDFGRALVKLGFTHDPCGNRLGYSVEMGLYLNCADDGYLTIIGPQNTKFNGCNAWTVPVGVVPEYHAKFETVRDAIAIPRVIRTIDDVRELMAAIGLKASE